jgi:hypothetical protein
MATSFQRLMLRGRSRNGHAEYIDMTGEQDNHQNRWDMDWDI